MNINITNFSGDTDEFECKDMIFENGFIVLKLEDDKDLFISPTKVAIMEVIDRPKKKEVKPKKEKL
jgi:hypothetical protein